MFKLSTLFRLLLSAGICRMTEDDTSGGTPSPSLPSGGGQPGLEGQPGGGGGGQPAEWDSVPKSWAAEHHPHWAAVPAPVRQILHKRESDFERGIRTYADGHGRWSKLHGLFKDIQDPNFKADELYETLAQNHIALARAEPSQRKAMFLAMAKHYGVDFAEAAASGGQGGESVITPAIQRILDEKLSPLMEKVQGFESHAMAQKQKEVKQVVDAFFSNPKNKYAKDVGPAMAELLNSRRAPDIESAYMQAVLADTKVRALYLADLAKEAEAGQGTLGGPAGPELKSSAAPASPGKPKTMDETMEAVAMKAFPGWKPKKSTV